MLKKHIYFVFLLAFSLFLIQCNSDATASQTVNEASSEVANKAKETTNAIKEVAKDAQTAVQDAAASAKEATPTLTKTKEAVEETASKTVAKAKEVALKAKEEVKKEEPVKKKTVKKKKKRSKISFYNTSHEFGTIKQGEVIKYDFKFKNRGDAPLVIKKVDVSCGCTFPSYPFIPIEPGKTGTIGITYDSKNKMGRQKPTITVVTNGRPSTIKLNLEGTVQ